MKQPAVLALFGPTASGKTALACELVDALKGEFGVELVSVDSALVYREMDIGTAKPDVAMLRRYPHHLVNLIAPTQSYSAADFRRDALAAIVQIHQRGNIPLLVGGTMMYVKALFDGLSALPPADESIRAAIEAEALVSGWPAMHAQLASVDPLAARRLSPNDSQRIQRALEVYRITGQPLSSLQTRAAVVRTLGALPAFPYQAMMFALLPSARAQLHRRIEQRFDAMLDAGLVDEVRRLRASHQLHADMPSMRTVGYRQVWQFLEGDISEGTMREHAVAATRQLAKRQMTWLRSMPDVESLDCLAASTRPFVTERVRNFLRSGN